MWQRLTSGLPSRAFPAECRPRESTPMTRIAANPPSSSAFSAALSSLALAQKPAARSAPAYSRFVNRRLGRFLAAWAYTAGMTPNAVTAVSAVFTAGALVILVAVPPSTGSGITVSALLLIGYAFDSADGQLARLTSASSPAGEWLDHFVDAIKASALPLALLAGLYRFEVVATEWLLVPLLAALTSPVLFFAMILTEQLRRAHSRLPLAPTDGKNASRGGWVRSLAVVPMDYGVLCLSFALLGYLPAFLLVYSLIVAATTLFLGLAAVKWFRELAAIGADDE